MTLAQQFKAYVDALEETCPGLTDAFLVAAWLKDNDPKGRGQLLPHKDGVMFTFTDDSFALVHLDGTVIAGARQ